MKNKKLLFFAFLSLAALLLLSSCSNANILLSLSPNPVEFSESEPEKELTLKIETEGIGEISLNQLLVELMDQDGEVILDGKKAIDIQDQVIVGGLSEEVKYTLDLREILKSDDYNYNDFSELYNDLLKGNTHSLRLTVTGSITTTLEAEVIYN